MLFFKFLSYYIFFKSPLQKITISIIHTYPLSLTNNIEGPFFVCGHKISFNLLVIKWQIKNHITKVFPFLQFNFQYRPIESPLKCPLPFCLLSLQV